MEFTGSVNASYRLRTEVPVKIPEGHSTEQVTAETQLRAAETVARRADKAIKTIEIKQPKCPPNVWQAMIARLKATDCRIEVGLDGIFVTGSASEIETATAFVELLSSGMSEETALRCLQLPEPGILPQPLLKQIMQTLQEAGDFASALRVVKSLCPIVRGDTTWCLAVDLGRKLCTLGEIETFDSLLDSLKPSREFVLDVLSDSDTIKATNPMLAFSTLGKLLEDKSNKNNYDPTVLVQAIFAKGSPIGIDKETFFTRVFRRSANLNPTQFAQLYAAAMPNSNDAEREAALMLHGALTSSPNGALTVLDYVKGALPMEVVKSFAKWARTRQPVLL